jgi:hypothetical protein
VARCRWWPESWHKVPFFHAPVTPENMAAAEARLLEIA